MPHLPDTDHGVALTTRHSVAGIKSEAILKQYEDEKPPAPPRVPENVSLNLSLVKPKDYPLFEKFFEFNREVTKIVQTTIFDTLTADPENWGRDRKAIVDHLRAKKIDQPRFQIIPKNELSRVAEKIGLDLDETYNPTAIDENEWFCVFTSAKPLEQYWRKGATQWADVDEVEKQIINWGEIYESAMPKIWELIDNYQTSSGLTLTRLNPPGTHVPRKLYYVWGIRLTEPEPDSE